jgi:hypothetical protein
VRASRAATARKALRFAAGLLGSTALFYVLRAAGLGLAPSLLIGALVSAAPGLWQLARGQRPQGLDAFLLVLLLLAAAVALLPGDERFLLAREALLTGTAGIWFLASTRGSRPLAYQFSKPLAEGRLNWPGGWEELWASSPAWRRMWRTSSILWGIGTLVDAVLRVVFAYTLPPDQVPALSLGLFLATALVLNIITNIYYFRCGVFDPRGPLHQPEREPAQASAT